MRAFDDAGAFDRGMQEMKPDLLLLDIGLPDGDGIELCRYSTEKMEIPVLLLTAKDEEADIIHGFDAGCEDYIVKPFSTDILKRRIDVALRRKRGKNLFQSGSLQVDLPCCRKSGIRKAHLWKKIRFLLQLPGFGKR